MQNNNDPQQPVNPNNEPAEPLTPSAGLTPQAPFNDITPAQPVVSAPVAPAPVPVPDASSVNPATQPAPAPVPMASQGMPPAPKKSAKLKIIILSVVGLLLVAGIAAAVYFFVLRVSDEEYANAVTSSETMRQESTKFDSFAKDAGAGFLAVEDAKVTEAEETVKKYQDALKKLQDSPVVARDSAAKAEYEKFKQAFESRASEMDRVVTTVKGLKSHLKACNEVPEGVDATEALGACMELLKNEDAYPDASLDEWYQDYRVLTLETYELVSEIGEKTSGGDITQAEAAVFAGKLDEIAKKLEAHVGELKLDIGGQNPKDQFNSFEGFLNNRKSTFLR